MVELNSTAAHDDGSSASMGYSGKGLSLQIRPTRTPGFH